MTLVFKQLWSQRNVSQCISKLKWDTNKPLKIMSVFSNPLNYDYVKDNQVILESIDLLDSHIEEKVSYINTLLKNNNKLHFIKEDITLTMADYPLKIEITETKKDIHSVLKDSYNKDENNKQDRIDAIFDTIFNISLSVSITFLMWKALR